MMCVADKFAIICLEAIDDIDEKKICSSQQFLIQKKK